MATTHTKKRSRIQEFNRNLSIKRSTIERIQNILRRIGEGIIENGEINGQTLASLFSPTKS